MPRFDSMEWWPEFLERLQTEPVSSLAEDYGISAAELDEALRDASHMGPAQDEPWWPEVMRLHTEGSLRDLARRFGTNPRRIRRGLARLGVRVGGRILGDEGVPALAPLRDRLGQEPDGVIAEEAGVTTEVVQGERRRLGIAPYRVLSEAEAFGAPLMADRQRLRRRRDELPEPEIIRRKVFRKASSPETVFETESEASGAGDDREPLHQVERQQIIGEGAAADEEQLFTEDVPYRRAVGEDLASGGFATGDQLELGFGAVKRGSGRRRYLRPESDSGPYADARATENTLKEARSAKVSRAEPVSRRVRAPIRSGTGSSRRNVIELTPAPSSTDHITIKPDTLPPEPAAEAPAPPSTDPATIEPDTLPPEPGPELRGGRSASSPRPPEPPQPPEPPTSVSRPPGVSPQRTPARGPAPGVDRTTPARALFAWEVEFDGDGSPLMVLAGSMLEAVEVAARKLGQEKLRDARARRLCTAFADD